MSDEWKRNLFRRIPSLFLYSSLNVSDTRSQWRPGGAGGACNKRTCTVHSSPRTFSSRVPVSNPYPSPREVSDFPAAERFALSPRYKWSVVGECSGLSASSTTPTAPRFRRFSRGACSKSTASTKTEQGIGSSSAFMWVYALLTPFAGLVAGSLPCPEADHPGRSLRVEHRHRLQRLCGKVWHFVLGAARAEGLGETFYFPGLDVARERLPTAARVRARWDWHQTSVYAGTIGGGAIGRRDGRNSSVGGRRLRNLRRRRLHPRPGAGLVHPRTGAGRSGTPIGRRTRNALPALPPQPEVPWESTSARNPAHHGRSWAWPWNSANTADGDLPDGPAL